MRRRVVFRLTLGIVSTLLERKAPTRLNKKHKPQLRNIPATDNKYLQGGYVLILYIYNIDHAQTHIHKTWIYAFRIWTQIRSRPHFLAFLVIITFPLRIWLRRTDAFSFCACSQCHGKLTYLTFYFLGYANNTCLISLRRFTYTLLTLSLASATEMWCRITRFNRLWNDSHQT